MLFRSHRFCLGVAHTHVVFNHIRIASAFYETQEYEAAVIDALFAEPLKSGAYDTLVYFGHEFIVAERRRTYTAHTAGIETGVAFADALDPYVEYRRIVIWVNSSYLNRKENLEQCFNIDTKAVRLSSNLSKKLFNLAEELCIESRQSFLLSMS